MTTPPILTELAERVEKLTGPCRETDGLIYRSIDPVIENCATTWSAGLLALADKYEAGTAKAVATGYEEYGEAFQRERKMIVDALRLAAKPAEDVREARDAFLSMICDAHKWQEDVDGDEQDGRTVTWVTYTIVTGHSQLEELANAIGIKAPFGETIKATIDLEIEKDIRALSTPGQPKP